MNFASPGASTAHKKAEQSICLAKSVVADVIDGEAIIVDLDTGTYYSATGFSAIFVEILMKSNHIDTIVEQICLRLSASKQDVLPAAHHVCSQLTSFGIITVSSGDFSEDLASIENIPFEGMSISQHTDMKQLLELDPVHHVDDSGWPNAANTI